MFPKHKIPGSSPGASAIYITREFRPCSRVINHSGHKGKKKMNADVAMFVVGMFLITTITGMLQK